MFTFYGWLVCNTWFSTVVGIIAIGNNCHPDNCHPRVIVGREHFPTLFSCFSL